MRPTTMKIIRKTILDLSAPQAAKALGFSRSAVVRIEDANLNASDKYLRRFKETFNITAEVIELANAIEKATEQAREIVKR